MPILIINLFLLSFLMGPKWFHQCIKKREKNECMNFSLHLLLLCCFWDLSFCSDLDLELMV